MDLGPGPYKYRAPNIQSAFRLWISTLAQDSRTSAVDFSSGLSSGLSTLDLEDSAHWTGLCTATAWTLGAALGMEPAQQTVQGVRSLEP